MEKGKGVMGMGRRWAIDFTDNSASPASRDVPDPLGFSRASLDQDDSAVSRQKKDAEANWKAQKAWEVAQAPFKNLMMMGFMMWMSGSTVHLFSIGITFSALWQPISALQGVGKVFEPYKDNKVELLVPKLVYIALNLGGLALGVWKIWGMFPCANMFLLGSLIHLAYFLHMHQIGSHPYLQHRRSNTLAGAFHYINATVSTISRSITKCGRKCWNEVFSVSHFVILGSVAGGVVQSWLIIYQGLVSITVVVE